ncbi:MAG TPA: hypothetical protein VH208_12635, partial [Myxococcaceae bacterium]|nr:hypothetical protein [Myxococcaceae bacterium]
MSGMRIAGKGAIALAFLLPWGALGSAVLEQSFEQMTASSPLVVRGTVGASEAHWDPAHHRIFTYTEIRADEEIKGHASPVLLIRSPGGEAEGIGQRVEGSPVFRPGESVVLFLERAPDEPGVMQVAALAAGKVSLVRSKLGELRATRDLRGLMRYRPGSIDRSAQLEVQDREDL